uniref:(California timema) hypothetical protein n=1 Tax=Timema californicum TaxID=61474 RepID=A0A7R9P3W7_TIMCA|nr:unnamed protein product [Timema californicum]
MRRSHVELRVRSTNRKSFVLYVDGFPLRNEFLHSFKISGGFIMNCCPLIKRYSRNRLDYGRWERSEFNPGQSQLSGLVTPKLTSLECLLGNDRPVFNYICTGLSCPTLVLWVPAKSPR